MTAACRYAFGFIGARESHRKINIDPASDTHQQRVFSPTLKHMCGDVSLTLLTIREVLVK